MHLLLAGFDREVPCCSKKLGEGLGVVNRHRIPFNKRYPFVSDKLTSYKYSTWTLGKFRFSILHVPIIGTQLCPIQETLFAN